MSPATVVIWASSVVVLLGLGAAAVTEPKFFDMWFWVVPLAAVMWIFVFVALAVPSILLLKLREWSAVAYIALLAAVGAAVGGGIGAANGAILGGIIVGTVVYLATALF